MCLCSQLNVMVTAEVTTISAKCNINQLQQSFTRLSKYHSVLNFFSQRSKGAAFEALSVVPHCCFYLYRSTNYTIVFSRIFMPLHGRACLESIRNECFSEITYSCLIVSIQTLSALCIYDILHKFFLDLNPLKTNEK